MFNTYRCHFYVYQKTQKRKGISNLDKLKKQSTPLLYTDIYAKTHKWPVTERSDFLHFKILKNIF